jgi:oligopeptide transport system permease protein
MQGMMRTRSRGARTVWLASWTILVLAAFALLVPLFSPYAYDQTNIACKNMAPEWAHPFGTDDLGRDLLTRTAQGLRLSLTIALLAAVIDVVIGVTWGLSCALFGGLYDEYMMRLADLIYSLPYLLVVILISVLTGPGLAPILTAMIMIGWIQMARLVRFQAREVRNREFVLAAITLGMSPVRIACRHVLPHMLGPMCAALLLNIPYAIFVEAFLSFLGIGIQPPQPSLGSMVAEGVGAMRYYPWRLFFPAGTISLVILAFNLQGDAIQEMLDPKKSYQ